MTWGPSCPSCPRDRLILQALCRPFQRVPNFQTIMCTCLPAYLHIYKVKFAVQTFLLSRKRGKRNLISSLSPASLHFTPLQGIRILSNHIPLPYLLPLPFTLTCLKSIILILIEAERNKGAPIWNNSSLQKIIKT